MIKEKSFLRLGLVSIGFAMIGTVLAMCGPLPAFSFSLAAHGRYIVERVGMCEDCHTPKGPRGEFLPGKKLQGTKLDFSPFHPVPGWKSKSVAIAGLPTGWTKANMVRFLEKGLPPKGHLSHPPMPAYRMTHRDALAVTLYLMEVGRQTPKR